MEFRKIPRDRGTSTFQNIVPNNLGSKYTIQTGVMVTNLPVRLEGCTLPQLFPELRIGGGLLKKFQWHEVRVRKLPGQSSLN